MSTVPKCSTVRSTQAWMSSSSFTSHTSASAEPPRSSISAATACTFDSVRAATVTPAPSAASAKAMPRPTPWPPPVTMAVFPSSIPMATNTIPASRANHGRPTMSGEGGIRTHEPPCGSYFLSREAPSTGLGHLSRPSHTSGSLPAGLYGLMRRCQQAVMKRRTRPGSPRS